MNRLTRTYSLLFLLTFAKLVGANSVTSDTLHELMLLSGTKGQIEELAGAVIAGLHQSKKSLSQDNERLISRELDSNILLDEISVQIGKELTEIEAKQLIKFYESNIGVRIARAEENAAKPEALIEMQKAAGMLLANKERLARAKLMEESIDLIDGAINIQANLGLAALVAVHNNNNPNSPPNIEMLKTMITSQLEGSRKNIGLSILVGILYTFKDFHLDDMDEYIKALNTTAMKNFNSGISSGMNTTFERAIVNIALEFETGK